MAGLRSAFDVLAALDASVWAMFHDCLSLPGPLVLTADPVTSSALSCTSRQDVVLFRGSDRQPDAVGE